jgi:DNA-binding MurR/RpiR family transcriptional regulator
MAKAAIRNKGTTGPERAGPGQHRGDLLALLKSSLPKLSRGQKHLAEYVLRNYQEVAFMGVTEVANATGVSPAAVVRFATALKFDGYPGFQRAVHDIIRWELSQGERLSATLKNIPSSNIADRILDREYQNLAALKKQLDMKRLARVTQELGCAKAVVIVGFRASTTLAYYLWYNLRKIRKSVELFTNPGSVTLEDLALTSYSQVVFVLITFPQYSQELLDIAALIQRSGFRSIGISNNELSPLVPLCDVALYAEVTEISFTDFYAAPVALLNALITNVAETIGGDALKRLDAFDAISAEHGYLLPRGRKPKR